MDRRAPLRTGRATPLPGSPRNFPSSQTLQTLLAILSRTLLQWQSWSSLKELIDKKQKKTTNRHVNARLSCLSSSHLQISEDPRSHPGPLPKQPAMGLLELNPTSSRARLSEKASDRSVELPFMDNWPQAFGEVFQFLITLALQKCVISRQGFLSSSYLQVAPTVLS